VLQTAVGLTIFLAYATTPVVARRLGEGDAAGAVRAGIHGVWVAIGVGLILLVTGIIGTRPIAEAFGAETTVTTAAADYLAIGVIGLPAMLVVLATTGLFRGLQDTKTPLRILGGGFAVNAALNWLLVFPAGLGLIGSAIGTVIAQWAMAVTMLAIVVVRARRAGVGLLPGRDGTLASAALGWWLFLRTLTLRIVLVGAVVAAAQHGTAALASTQVLFTVFSTAAFALDALAIAGQAMVGLALGRGAVGDARAILRRLVELSVIGGLAVGVVLAVASGAIAGFFTPDPAVQQIVAAGILVIAAGLPIGAVVWALDGVLIGAGDGRYLALAGVINLAVAAPLLVVLAGVPWPALWAVVAIQATFSIGYMLARLTTLALRARGDRWMRISV
jgi:putative MATE family efflux protein